MRRTEVFDPSMDFWKQFPELLDYEEFLGLKKEFPEKSSTFMWAIHRCEHPKSQIFKDPEKYSIPSIKKALDIGVSEERMTLLKKKYRGLVLSSGELQLIRWNNNLDKLNDKIESMLTQTLKPNELNSITGAMSKMSVLYKEYSNILDTIREEEKKGDEKGKSLSQQGLI